jgi:hypothetical protein
MKKAILLVALFGFLAIACEKKAEPQPEPEKIEMNTMETDSVTTDSVSTDSTTVN